MAVEIREIPPASRQVRWSTVLWSRWPVALVGGLAAILGGFWTWMLFLGSLGAQSQDPELDRAHELAVGKMLSTLDDDREFEGETWSRVRYIFDGDTPAQDHECFLPRALYAPGLACTIEHAPGMPHINRIQGGRRYLVPAWAQPGLYLGLLVFPGFLLLCLWLQGVVDLKRMMSDGDVSVAEVLDVHRVRFVSPAMLAVTFRFREHSSRQRVARHWVRARSPLGERLTTGLMVPVASHRRWPRFSRLCQPTDFIAPKRPVSGPHAGANLGA